ncbi:NAD-dependent epimerase/dehydratase family protein [Paenibacillus sp. 1A_MP2]|uniref:NAD-dependent epimerase/dehydratase family protein n=1 Tax=Paenibacillus sp. 1A_MP2 TaxID=3457495 RepID=UPI003FCCC738
MKCSLWKGYKEVTQMNVFITGATGWIGSATVDELLRAGYKVVGLARSDVSAASLEEKGATALRGDLDDLDVLRRGRPKLRLSSTWRTSMTGRILRSRIVLNGLQSKLSPRH